jgi:hypothetical protein
MLLCFNYASEVELHSAPQVQFFSLAAFIIVGVYFYSTTGVDGRKETSKKT